jgi:integrase/recombinase XerD
VARQSGETGVPQGPGRPWIQRIEEHLLVLRAEAGLAPASLKAYRRDLQGFGDFLEAAGALTPASLDAELMQAYLEHLKGTGQSAATRARRLAAVRGFVRGLVLEGQLLKDPAFGLETPKLTRRLPKLLSLAEVEILLQEPQPAGFRQLRVWALLEFLYGSGARISEALRLEAHDLSPDLRQARLFGKGSKSRLVPVGSRAARALAAWIQHGRSQVGAALLVPQIFVGSSGQAWDRHRAWAAVRSYARERGIQRAVSPHVLRHSFASHLVEAGADLRSVQEMLGHATIRTTEVYTHVDGERLRALHRLYHPRG